MVPGRREPGRREPSHDHGDGFGSAVALSLITVVMMATAGRLPGRADRAGERPPVVAAQPVHPDVRAAVRRVDEPGVADVDADMAETMEEHQVAGAQAGPRDVRIDAELAGRPARDG